ncbi:nuclear transport factor 2 family protein [Capillimicrobium parvum]|uniref:DUF4878 domain-containing protein n=1 Tax=Capillimicrobium parvum TaxID=2884022 RepID=A0A9E7C0J9_9ACTN|nr:DUF4878 domain-containing protein [Capillimicrobium parvum]UGS36495.1 hypothetical protein DSM104329_02901 [Capillimicrobium parvum]
MPTTSRRLRPLSLLVVTSTALALSACGGDDGGGGGTGTGSASSSAAGGDDREAITALVTDYTNAFADGDYDKACDFLTDDARQEIEKAAEQLDADGCTEALQKATDGLDDKTKETLRGLQVTSIELDGDRAVVRTKLKDSSEQTEPATVVKEDGEWRIAPTTGVQARTATVPTATVPESP